MAKYVDFKKINTLSETKHYGYLAFQFQCAAEAVKGTLDLGLGVLGKSDLGKLWELHNDLRTSAIALESSFDAKCRTEAGKIFGSPGGFAHPDSAADAVISYLEHREAHEEH